MTVWPPCTLLERVRARIADAGKARVRYLILDFHRVNGLDSSAALSFVRARQMADVQEITLVLTHITENIQHQFELEGLFENEKWIRIFPDLDHGLEWCEEQLLEIEQVTTLHTPITLTAQLADSGFERADTKRLLNYLERVTFNEGETLIHQGDEADRMYFIEMGAVSIYLELGSESRAIADARVGNSNWRTGSVSGDKIHRLRYRGHAGHCLSLDANGAY